MPRYIVKVDDLYLEYSTGVNSPITVGMTLGKFRAYYQEEYGRHGMDGFEERIKRADTYGTSATIPISADELMAGNRAGPNEVTLSLEELRAAYCLRKPVRGDWVPWTYDPDPQLSAEARAVASFLCSQEAEAMTAAEARAVASARWGAEAVEELRVYMEVNE